MRQRQPVSQNQLADHISLSGFLLALASLVPTLTQHQTSPAFWFLSAGGIAIIAFGVTVRVSRRAYDLVARLIDAPIATICTCPDQHVNEVYELARDFFGDDVTEPTKIHAIRSKYKNGLQVALREVKGGAMQVQGYYFMFPINKRCVEKIVDSSFEVSDLDADDIATRPRYGYAMYIGAIAGRGPMVRRELLGAIKLAHSVVIETKTRTAYARAATKRGQQLLQSHGFHPVNRYADCIGCFYSKKLDAETPLIEKAQPMRRRKRVVSASDRTPTPQL
jgi:hypothetical protein